MAPAALFTCVAAVACSDQPAEPVGKAAATTPTGSASAAPPAGPSVRVKGASMEVPKDYATLEPERLQRLKDSVGRPQDAKLELDGKRAPGAGTEGAAYVTRVEMPKNDELLHGTVSDLFTTIIDETKLGMEMALGPDNVEKFDVRHGAASTEVCSSAKMTKGPAAVRVNNCTTFFITPDHRIQSVAAACLEAPEQNVCEPILAKRKLDVPEDALVASTMLGPRRPAVDYLGFTLGQSKDEFAAACKAAGFKPLDLRVVPKDVSELFTSGRLVACNGKPKEFAFGSLLHVTAHFENEKSITIVFDVDATPADIAPKLEAAFGKSGMMSQEDGVRYVAPGAKGHELMLLRIAEPSITKAKASVTVLSRVAWERALAGQAAQAAQAGQGKKP